MTWALLLLAVAAVPEVNGQAAEVATALQPQVQTGTLLFSRGDCLAVKAYTASSFTHCSAVVVEPTGPVVYEATSGAGVRKLPLAEYLQRHESRPLLVYQPCAKLSPKQCVCFQNYLVSELGKKYGARQQVLGDSPELLHCSEYMTRGLMAMELIAARDPAKVSPATLELSLRKNQIYKHTLSIQVLPPPPPPPSRNWCVRAWQLTRDCTISCCVKLTKLFCCK